MIHILGWRDNVRDRDISRSIQECIGQSFALMGEDQSALRSVPLLPGGCRVDEAHLLLLLFHRDTPEGWTRKQLCSPHGAAPFS
jgi:hypothetical protein